MYAGLLQVRNNRRKYTLNVNKCLLSSWAGLCSHKKLYPRLDRNPVGQIHHWWGGSLTYLESCQSKGAAGNSAWRSHWLRWVPTFILARSNVPDWNADKFRVILACTLPGSGSPLLLRAGFRETHHRYPYWQPLVFKYWVRSLKILGLK